MQHERSESAAEILIKYLENLGKDELELFKFHLNSYTEEHGYSQIPTADLDNATYLQISEQMINHYNDEGALEITGYSLSKIPRMDLFEQFQRDSQKYLNMSQKMWNTKETDHKKNYMRYMGEEFRTMEDKNSRIGEKICLKERNTKLLIIKEHLRQAEGEHEIMSTGWEHLEIMGQRAEHSYSSIAALFDPEEDGHVPRTVVLQGVAGIGKTTAARHIMLDWASGELFQDRFDFLFYINCREINPVPGQQTMVEHLLLRYPWMSQLMSEIEADPEKVLFIIDGFDEFKPSVDLLSGDPGKETHKDNTIMSLIGKEFISQPYVLITTRPAALENLRQCVKVARFAEVLGFSEDDRKEYFTKFFKNETQGAQALTIVKENEILFTMCLIPIVCWIVCTVIKQQMEDNEDDMNSVKTATSVYMSFFCSLLKQQSSDSVQPIHMNLQKLCALAKDGVWEQKVLFYEEDLVSHGLDISAIQSLFQKNYIFQKDAERENCYSFIHLSFQEFFAAMFYLLKESGEMREDSVNPMPMDQTQLTPCGVIKPPVISLLESSTTQKHLTLTVRFLFGLLNKETLNLMENRFKWKISPDVKPALLEWIKEEIKQDFIEITNEQMQLIHCLYEIQDEEFVRSATERVKLIGVYSELLERHMTAMDFRALGFCIMNSPRVKDVTIGDFEMKPEDLRALTPGLMTSPRLELLNCAFTAAHCAELCSILSTNTSLVEFNLKGNTLGDSGVIALCEGLKAPGCRVHTLDLSNNGLTDASTEALCSALSTNHALRELELFQNSFTETSEAAFREFEASGRLIDF